MPEIPEDDSQKIEEICDDFLRKLKAGQRPDLAALVSERPELEPELKNRLELIEAVFQAAKSPSDASEEATNLAGDSSQDDFQLAQTSIKEANSESASPFYNRAHRISCPHCGNVVQLVSRGPSEVTCRSCGSAVTLDPEATTSELPAELPVQIGRFQIMRLLGEGAFGAVFLAFDPQLKRQVALKVPRAGYFQSSSEEQRFYREAQSAAKLHHTNIVPVHEVSQDKKTPYIVSEFIDGVTMNDLASTGLLTFREIAELMVKVCDAVGYAHGEGVIHRDLKPSNIMVDSQRNPWVADFGLARRDDAEITMTVDGMVLGTPAYMAPEQAAGIHQKVDARSDIYSLGVVLYKLMARELPFSGTRRMLLHQVIHDDPKSPRKFNDNIPKDLETITLKALSKSQEGRFQRTEDFKAELQRWLNGEPIESRRTGVAVRFWKWCKRYPVVAGLCTAIACMLVFGTVFASYKAAEESRLRKEAENNAAVATRRKEESDSRLHALYQSKASAALHENRLFESGYWYAEALKLKDRPVDRKRLAAIYDRTPKLQAAFPIESKAQSIAISSNEKMLVVGTEQGKARLFDLGSRKLLFETSADEPFPVHQVELLANDSVLLFRSGADECRMWDIENKKMIRQLQVPAFKKKVVVSPDRKLLAKVGKDSTVEMLDAKSGESKQKLAMEGIVNFLEFPSSETVLIGTHSDDKQKQQMQLFETSSGDPVWSKAFEAGLDFVLSKDGTRIASLFERRQVKLWETGSGDQFGLAFDSEAEVKQVLFANNSTISLLSGNRMIQTVEFTADEVSRSVDYLEFRPLVLMPVGRTDLVAAKDQRQELQILMQDSWIEAVSRIPKMGMQTAVGFSSEGSVLAVGGQAKVQVWSLAGASPEKFEFQHEGMVRDGIFSPDGQLCYTVGSDGKAKIWDAAGGKRVGKVMSHDGIITKCVLSPDGQRLFTAGYDKKAKVWDALTGEQIGPSLAHSSPVVELAITPDGKFLLTGCFDGACYCWNPGSDEAKEPAPVYTVKHPEIVRRIDVASTGKFFATVFFNGHVRLWDTVTGNPLGVIKSADIAWDCCLSPDATKVAVVWQNRKVEVWKTGDRSKVASFDLESAAMHLRFDSNNQFRVGGFSGVATVWRDDGNGFEELISFREPGISKQNFSDWRKDERLIVSAGAANVGASGAGIAAVWSLEDGNLVWPSMIHGAEVWRARFGPHGKRLLTSAMDGTATLWDLNTNEFEAALAQVFQLIRPCNDSVESVRENKASEMETLFETHPELFEVSRLRRKQWEELFLRSAATSKQKKSKVKALGN